MTTALTNNDHVVVVGAGLAGWRLCEGLRRDGFDGQITLIGDESNLPYDRPPLSKQVMTGKWPSEQANLVDLTRVTDLKIDFRSSQRARRLDVSKRTVELESGEHVSGTHIVLAPGCSAREIDYDARKSLHHVRSINDATRLIDAVEQLEAGSPIIVIGGGFIGAEIATSLTTRGHRLVVLEATAMPLLNVLGDEVARRLLRLPSDAGVDLRVNQHVTNVVNTSRGCAVEMGDGSTLEAPVVVVAVGAVPNIAWLKNSGLTIDNGIVTNDQLCAAEGIFALGDAANFTWRHDPFVEQVRIEHWQVANDHAQFLTQALLKGNDAPVLSLVPYFWSDQYGKKIQLLGHYSPGDDVTWVAGSIDDGRWLGLYSRHGLVSAAVSVNFARGLMLSRDLVQSHVRLSDAIALAPWSPPTS